MMRLLLALAILSLPLQAESGIPDETPIKYNEWTLKSVHNAYQRKESLPEMLDLGLRSLELDIHSSKLGLPTRNGYWYVYHHVMDWKTTVDGLIDGLAYLRNSEGPITLWLDIKSKFRAGHTPDDLDQLLRAELGERLFTPWDLVALCPEAETLADFLIRKDCSWPEVSSLNGRVLVVLTGSDLAAYAPDQQQALLRTAFLAPETKSLAQLANPPQAVFANIPKAQALGSSLARDLQALKIVSRTWDLNSASDWRKALERGVNHLATDKVNIERDPWAVVPTFSALGSR